MDPHIWSVGIFLLVIGFFLFGKSRRDVFLADDSQRRAVGAEHLELVPLGIAVDDPVPPIDRPPQDRKIGIEIVAHALGLPILSVGLDLLEPGIVEAQVVKDVRPDVPIAVNQDASPRIDPQPEDVQGGQGDRPQRAALAGIEDEHSMAAALDGELPVPGDSDDLGPLQIAGVRVRSSK